MTKFIFLPAVLLLLVPASGQVTQSSQPSGAAQSIETLPPTESGFQAQFNAAVQAYRTGDNATGRRLLDQFRLPQPAEWLTEHLGPEQSENLAERYDPLVANFSDSLEKTALDVIRTPEAIFVLTLRDGSEDIRYAPPPDRKVSGIRAIKKPALFFCQFTIQIKGKIQVAWADVFTYEDGAFRFVGFGGPPFWVWETGSEGKAPEQGSFVVPAALISAVQAVYPASAKMVGIRGIVSLHYLIDKKGMVGKITVVQGDPILAQAAMDAVKQWRYKPATMGGLPVESAADVRMQFPP